MSLKVLLNSSSLIHTEALSSLITSFGYKVTNSSSASPQVAVWSLTHPPFPKPRPSLPTLAIVTFTDDDNLLELLSLGYRGYHLPDKPSAQLKQAIQAIYEGEVWAERRIVAQALTPAVTPNLTPRQAEVMNLLKLGHSNKRIAAELSVAEKTVKAHVSAILEKFGAKNRVGLLVSAAPRAEEHY